MPYFKVGKWPKMCINGSPAGLLRQGIPESFGQAFSPTARLQAPPCRAKIQSPAMCVPLPAFVSGIPNMRPRAAQGLGCFRYALPEGSGVPGFCHTAVLRTGGKAMRLHRLGSAPTTNSERGLYNAAKAASKRNRSPQIGGFEFHRQDPRNRCALPVTHQAHGFADPPGLSKNSPMGASHGTKEGLSVSLLLNRS
jgi:hypothetical protein